MNMTLQSSIKDMILSAQKEASDESTRSQRGLYEVIELRNDGALYYLVRIWVLLKGDVWYVIRVATLRALVYVGDKTNRDARSWYMISEDAKSWDHD
ncbi:hypothetical protein Tco_0662803 [Tanacetum coccineum]